MLHRRTATYFKNSIMEGTQSNINAGNSGRPTNSIFNAFFQKPKTHQLSQENRLTESTSPETPQQLSQKILLFEDIDQVFNDESDFHSQLLKLICVTKVPIIITLSKITDDVNRSFIEPFKEMNIDYDLVNYKY